MICLIFWKGARVASRQLPQRPHRHNCISVVFISRSLKKNLTMANFNQKDQRKREHVRKFEVQRQLLKALIKNQTLSQSLRYEYMLKLHAFAKQTSQVQVVKRCVLSGRSRGVLKHFKLSRIWVRQLLATGQLQGTTKSSW